MPRIFISYRRADSGGWVTAIYRELIRHFDPADLFRDIDTIDYGVDFVETIESAVRQCDVLLAVIGPHWKTSANEAGQRRLDDPNDFVRLEIAAALKRNIRVIPVLVGGAAMPPSDDLPIDLQMLSRRNAMEIDDQDFDHHVERLVGTLQRIQGAPSLTIPISQPKPYISRVTNLLPAPFEWREIPAGKVTIENLGTSEVSAFLIAKYPITNKQYAQFIEASGYHEEKWWTVEGWQQREKDSWVEPRYWQDSQFNGDEQPVVGVSWYEAVAFCQWLSEVSDESVMLPTEQQWQRAAQGDDRRAYPWGNDWDGTRCNNSVHPHDSHRTTPVQQYEGRGDSPFGAVDMAGNVWEWCLTAYETDSTSLNRIDARVHRGGAWRLNNAADFHTSYRFKRNPFSWYNLVGFRCTRFR